MGLTDTRTEDKQFLGHQGVCLDENVRPAFNGEPMHMNYASDMIFLAQAGTRNHTHLKPCLTWSIDIHTGT